MSAYADYQLANKWRTNTQVVRTKKGAPFTGVVVGDYFNRALGHFGVCVMAIHKEFEGSVHVYPVAQLEEVNNEDT